MVEASHKPKLPVAEQHSVIAPLIRKFVPETPIEIIADVLREDSKDAHAEWLLGHPRFVATIRRQYAEEQLERALHPDRIYLHDPRVAELIREAESGRHPDKLMKQWDVHPQVGYAIWNAYRDRQYVIGKKYSGLTLEELATCDPSREEEGFVDTYLRHAVNGVRSLRQLQAVESKHPWQRSIISKRIAELTKLREIEPGCPFKTMAAARAAGFHLKGDDHYGGEQWTIKGRPFVRNAKRAMSQSEWSRNGCKVKDGAKPLTVLTGRHCRYEVYCEDQVIPKKRRADSAPATQVPILAALFALNRRAKRFRDQAASYYEFGMYGFATRSRMEKESLYSLKSQALHYLIAEGELRVSGYHRFPDGNCAEVLCGGGYTFHRPCSEPTPANKTEAIDIIESKPRSVREPRFKDAMHTIRSYLDGKPKVAVYEWEKKTKLCNDELDEDEAVA